MGKRLTLDDRDVISRLVTIREQKESKRPKVVSEKDRVEHLKHWTTFYRRNINLYIQDRLGIRLEPYQHLIIYLMNISTVFAGICARGSSKSFLSACLACAYSLLYPKHDTVITATTVSQGLVIFNKIKNELCGGSTKNGLSPILSYLYRRDLIHFRVSDTALEIEFTFNGSKIKVLPPIDSSRGERANLLIYDEFRLLKKADIDSIFEPMLYRRPSAFMNLEEYSMHNEMAEDGKSIYISSSFWKNEWAWRFAKNVITDMLNNNTKVPSNLFATDIFLPMQYNRMTVPQYYKLKAQLSDISFRVEILNECIGEVEDAYFTIDEFKANQTLPKGFRTPTITEYITHVDMGNRAKKDNEIRVLGIDFAFEKSHNTSNDNTVFGVMSCFWDGERLRRNLDYMESMEGGGYPVQRIRELYHDLDIDYIIFDSKNGGDVYAQQLTESFYHKERGIEYHGFTTATERELQIASNTKVEALESKTVDPLAIPCLVPIAGTADLNSIIWQNLKVLIMNGNIRFLSSELELEQNYDSTKAKRTAWAKYTSEEKMRIKLPHVQTDMLIEEAVNLTPKFNDGKVKLVEASNAWKDRVVVLGYLAYFSTLLENKLSKENETPQYDVDDWVLVV